MKFTKPPLGIQEQLDLLVKRGLTVPDPQKAAKYLSNISYYRLSAYAVSLRVPGDPLHTFMPGYSFDDLLDLYLFDRELRLLIFDAIERTEVSFRTQLINHFSVAHHAHWYEEANLFTNYTYHANAVRKLDEELNRSGEVFIKHYQNTYTSPQRPPAWMSFEVASMGLLSRFYRELKMCDAKKEIARHYGLGHPKMLESWMQSTSYVRNICAHHGRLWNRVITVKPTLPKQTAQVWLSNTAIADNRIYAFLCCLLYLRKMVNPHTAFANRLSKLFVRFPRVDSAKMGFPADWKAERLWK